MRRFADAGGRAWVAGALEEDTPRHHGRWYLVFHPEDDPSGIYPVPEVRWQKPESAARTLNTMSEFELRRRLESVLGRSTVPPTEAASPADGLPHGVADH